MAWWKGNRVRLPAALYQTAEAHAGQAGYASVDEFVEHCVRQQLQRNIPQEDGTDAQLLQARLRGLGYVE